MTKVVLPGQNTAGQPGGYAVLDGASGLLVPAYLEAAQQSSPPAAPATGKTRLYVDTNGILQLLPAAGAARRVTTHWGTLTAFPAAAGVAPGDTCIRSDVGTNGTLYYFQGGAVGAAGWVPDGLILTTAAGLSGIPAAVLYNGGQAYATDTGDVWTYNGGTSLWEGGWVTYTPTWTCAGTGATNPTLGNGTLIGLYRKQGRKVDLKLALLFGSTTNGGTGGYRWTLPFASSGAHQQTVGISKCYTTSASPYTGHAYIATAGTYVEAMMPLSSTNTSCGSSQNAAAGNNTQGTGIPLVSGGWTFGGTGDIQIMASYESAV